MKATISHRSNKLKEENMSKNTPFFNHFIESQIEELNDTETTQCSGGFAGINISMKHPSDNDEGQPIDIGIRPIDVTMKYPSDDDEGVEIKLDR
ncbi:bacteriocin leader domain-containing protein [Vibrio sp. vnigr-6D03]|nr:bacteriocin leader domain-containing protein [Vibrio sp. vnigr-6D03]